MKKFQESLAKARHRTVHFSKKLYATRTFQTIAVTIVVLAALIATFSTGAYLGEQNFVPGIEGATTLSNKTNTDASTTVDFGTFWKVWNLVNEKFVATHPNQKNDDQQKVYGAIQGMVNSLGDPYTVFLPPQELGNFNVDITGNFEGVGMEVGPENGQVVVIAPIKGSPADLAGIQTGDIVIKVDDTTIDPATMTVDDVVNLIRGKAGTQVKISILRGKETTPRVFTVTRQTINVPTVTTSTQTISTPTGTQSAFVITLSTFTADSPDLFRNALRDFINSGTNKLIIDLRGNPGGYLDAAVDMASWFLPKQDVVVTEDFDGKQPQQSYNSSGYDIFSSNLKLAILVDDGSASAAEILTGALAQYGKATVVGEKTFGKGSVQELIPITSDSSLKVTVARWLTPNGTWISGNGITPNVVVDRTQDDIAAGKDPQMQAALQVLTGTYAGAYTASTSTAAVTATSTSAK